MSKEKTDCLEQNDQVNRAEATASTEAQNTDAASVVPTSESVDGGSGSTPCSFSAISSRELFNKDSGTPSGLIAIPEDLNGNVVVTHNNTSVTYEFEGGRLKSVAY